jgi:hypothetical protein
MSKEMMVIALGLWIIVVRTLLGIPGSWQTFLLVLTGVALAVIGFLLRGEALSRGVTRHPRTERGGSYPFVESQSPSAHEHKEGITSLN